MVLRSAVGESGTNESADYVQDSSSEKSVGWLLMTIHHKEDESARHQDQG